MNDSKNLKRGNKTKITVAVFSLFGVFVIASGAWFWSMSSVPNSVIPTHSVPNPNALDTFATAASLVLDETKMDYARSSKHTGRTFDDHEYTLTEMDALLAENEPALKLFREGMTQEYMTPPIRSSKTLLPYLAGQRKLARLLAFAAVVHGKHGDWKKALETRIEGVELGDRTKTGGVLIHDLVGVAIQAIVERGSFSEVDHLTGTEAKQLALKLQSIIEKEPSFTEILQEDSYAGQANMLEIIRESKTYNDVYQLFNNSQNSTNNANPQAHALALRYLFSDKRKIVRDYKSYMKAQIVNSRLPYAEHPLEPKIPTDPLSELTLSVFTDARFKDLQLKSSTRMLLLALALQAYKAEHGAYPETLSKLVPEILAKEPDDFFAKTGGFGYRRDKERYILYSVGPDGIDNGGRAIIDSSQPANSTLRTYPQVNSKGDILLGTNVK